MPTAKKYDSANYVCSKEEANQLRTEYLNGPMKEYVRRFMASYPQVQTVVIKVAQYYNDEAADAVHFRMYPSVLESFWTPDPPKPWKNRKGQVVIPEAPDYYNEGEGSLEVLRKNLPFLGLPGGTKERDYRRYCYSVGDAIYRWEDRVLGWNHWLRKACWENNGAMIPLFASFCSGDGGSDSYMPIALYRTRQWDDLDFKFIGKMLRLEMDGIKPEYDDDDELFSYLRKRITKCEESLRDPLVEMREHVRRIDIIDQNLERNFPPGVLCWTHKGPAIRESEGERISLQDDALSELREEWARREAWDATFNERYGKG